VILHYLRLSFWPDKLVLDYGWPIAATFAGFAASGAVLIALLAAVAAALLYRPALGFLGLWFFLILSPTSSFVPIIDPAFEHRMYLPLAAVVAATVIPVYYLGRSVLERLAVPGRHSRAAALVACVLAAAAITVLAMLTVRRNYDYRDEISIWTDTVAKRPVSPRAHCELGVAYIRAGLCQQAIASYSQAIKLNPNYALAYNNRGFAYLYTGDYDRAISDLDKSIARNPNYPVAYSNRAIAYGSKGDFDHALSDFTRALKLNPTSPDDYFHRGINYASKGDYDQAIRDYDMAIKLNPRHAAAHEAKVAALAAKGKSAEHQ
jgi:tetratricopeptide (TPR) repeat protein